ncbi:MAG TPA: histidinol dehydrogenase [Cytophagaceae bacterium]|jgi:histidinol dehydrogenase|nr:histidinol dehydrogenase [Cytophagaceae bacterium]
MNYIQYPDKSEWKQLLARPVLDTSSLEGKVLPILQQVKERGDSALKEFTYEFDKIKIDTLLVTELEIKEALTLVSDELKTAIDKARINIEKFHLSQREEIRKVETTPGVVCWRKSVPISKVGLYIPGGTAPLFSTILMLGVPANIAGCEEIIVCTPPDKQGKVHPAILYTASVLGITKIFKIGGAQAIAAMAFGTETIPSVYKIFGPGNQYVTLAKQLVLRMGVAIDMPAGPSEVAIIADETCQPAFVAADLLSQAEHGNDSQVILVSNSNEVIEAVKTELAKQLELLPRKEFAGKALLNSKLFLMKNLTEAMELVNEYAPEHLILQVKEYDKWSSMVINAGSVFLGNYTPEAAGDYASGTNHTLPTNGYAKTYSGVSLDSFVKKITFQHISKEGIQLLGPVIEKMAAAEQLEAHKNAVSLRMKI